MESFYPQHEQGIDSDDAAMVALLEAFVNTDCETVGEVSALENTPDSCSLLPATCTLSQLELTSGTESPNLVSPPSSDENAIKSTLPPDAMDELDWISSQMASFEAGEDMTATLNMPSTPYIHPQPVYIQSVYSAQPVDPQQFYPQPFYQQSVCLPQPAYQHPIYPPIIYPQPIFEQSVYYPQQSNNMSFLHTQTPPQHQTCVPLPSYTNQRMIFAGSGPASSASDTAAARAASNQRSWTFVNESVPSDFYANPNNHGRWAVDTAGNRRYLNAPSTKRPRATERQYDK